MAADAEWAGSWGVEGRTGHEERRMFRWGRGLRTSLNSTLLWKLQLPLSRLALRPHPSVSALLAAQTSPIGLHPINSRWVQVPASCSWGTTKPNHTGMSMCLLVCIWSAKPFTCTKRYPKNIWWRQKPMRDKTSTYFYLFIVRVTLKSTEKLGREENRGGWCWEGS